MVSVSAVAKRVVMLLSVLAFSVSCGDSGDGETSDPILAAREACRKFDPPELGLLFWDGKDRILTIRDSADGDPEVLDVIYCVLDELNASDEVTSEFRSTTLGDGLHSAGLPSGIEVGWKFGGNEGSTMLMWVSYSS